MKLQTGWLEFLSAKKLVSTYNCSRDWHQLPIPCKVSIPSLLSLCPTLCRCAAVAAGYSENSPPATTRNYTKPPISTSLSIVNQQCFKNLRTGVGLGGSLRSISASSTRNVYLFLDMPQTFDSQYLTLNLPSLKNYSHCIWHHYLTSFPGVIFDSSLPFTPIQVL